MDTLAYAAYLKDKEILLKSSSGGAFTALSNIALERGDGVVCCLYNPDVDEVELHLIKTKEERNKAMGSKYIQSSMLKTYSEIEVFINNNPEKKVMAFGTGCQMAGLLGFSKQKGIRDKIIFIDIICHGTPSPQIWKEYIADVKKSHPGKVDSLSFRVKKDCWENTTSVAIIDGKEVSVNNYKKYYYGAMTLRPSCYECHFAKIQRDTDITIGDYWGIKEKHPEFFNSNGVSVILVHSQVGLDYWNQARINMEWIETSREDALQSNLIRPTKKHKKRDQFMGEYVKHGFCFVNKKYAQDSMIGKVRRYLAKKL